MRVLLQYKGCEDNQEMASALTGLLLGKQGKQHHGIVPFFNSHFQFISFCLFSRQSNFFSQFLKFLISSFTSLQSLLSLIYPSAKKINALLHRSAQFSSFPTQCNSLAPHPVTTSCLLEEELSLTLIKCYFIGIYYWQSGFYLHFYSHIFQFSLAHENLFFQECVTFFFFFLA